MTAMSPHRASCRVLYGDTDAGGVVYYANYLRFFEFGRTEFMRDLVVPYAALQEQGMILPVVECHCRYKAPARYDDLLTVETSLTKVKSVSCRFDYRLILEEQAKLLAVGFTVHAMVDREGKLMCMPASLIALLEKVRTVAE